ncbi:dipeptide ABC transporter ATP-binding protein [Burkholderia aenigmatica]|uniref:dipeptide ABC transporter ATP-binding protein n=1 Tax=Burkholderia aenigmatica TaxID=2015348 RepID=UPI003B43CC68
MTTRFEDNVKTSSVPMPDEPLLSIRDLSISFPSAHGEDKRVVRDISLDLRAGESLAVVGESGSGKTMIGKALIGLLPDAARITSGRVTFAGRELLEQTPAQWREIRGADIGMVFQEPMVSLNPAFRVGEQLTEALIRRRGVAPAKAWALAVLMLERVRVRDPEGCMRRYPHEFSGGMRQRLIIAAVMLQRPKLLIADEPTTALDCVVQKEVLDLLVELTKEEGASLIFISHNLALVAAYTQKVLVMRRGDAVEMGPVANVLSRPEQAYTLNLLDALPRRLPDHGPKPDSSDSTPVLDVRKVAVDYNNRKRSWSGQRTVRVVHPMSFSLRQGETLAIVGESGSGKTSLTNAIIGLVGVAEGSVTLNGTNFLDAGSKKLREARRAIGVIFQDPYSSLDPRMKVASIVRESLQQVPGLSEADKLERVREALDDVGLAEFANRFINELSGGQRQRVAIARAIVGRPAVVIADEPVSALDVTVQKQVLDMLRSLQISYGFACLIISHDLGVVEQLADRVIVMYRGHVVEEGTRDEVFDSPAHPYTRRLLQAVPDLKGDREHGFSVRAREIPPLIGLIGDYFDPDTDRANQEFAMREMPQSGMSHRVAVWR